MTRFPALAKEQKPGGVEVTKIYKIVRNNIELPEKEIYRGIAEFKQLYKMRHSMRINEMQILKVGFIENQEEKWIVICRSSMR